MAEVSGPRTQRKRPADFTGRQSEILNDQKAAEKQEAASRMALLTEAQAEENNTIVDYTGADIPLPEVQVQEVEINDPYRTIRVNTKIEQMTFGRRVQSPGDPEHGIPAIMGDLPVYTFEEGRSYRVPRDMAEHLQRLGYLAYMGN
jgi:hypothetical protein